MVFSQYAFVAGGRVECRTVDQQCRLLLQRGVECCSELLNHELVKVSSVKVKMSEACRLDHVYLISFNHLKIVLNSEDLGARKSKRQGSTVPPAVARRAALLSVGRSC